MPERALGIGIVGCGRATETLHLPALRRVGRARVVAVCDEDPSALERVAAAAGVTRRYTILEELLDDPAVTAVAVCTPPASHAVLALGALAAGRHVFVEKPLALDPAEAERMCDAAREAGTVTAAGFNLRCHRLVEQARRLLHAGAVGEVRLVRSSWTAGFGRDRPPPGWRRDRDAGGGVLAELGSHCADLAHHLLGEEIAEVTALGVDGADTEAAAVAGRTKGGAVVGWLLGEGVVDANELEIAGTQGRIALSLYRGDSLAVVRRGRMHGAGARLEAALRRGRAAAGALGAARRGGDFVDSYCRQWERFVAAALDGSSVAATWQDGLAAARVVAAARRALASGRLEAVERG